MGYGEKGHGKVRHGETGYGEAGAYDYHNSILYFKYFNFCAICYRLIYFKDLFNWSIVGNLDIL